MSLSKKQWICIYAECSILYNDLACKIEGVDFHTNNVIVERVNYPINKVKLILTEMDDLTDEDYLEMFKFLDDTFPDDMADFNETHLPKSQFLKEFNNIDLTYGLADLFRKLGYAIGIPKKYYTTLKEISNPEH